MTFGPSDRELYAQCAAYRTLGSLDVMIDMLDAVLQEVDPDITSTDYCPSFEKDLAEAYERLDQALQLLIGARADLYIRTVTE